MRIGIKQSDVDEPTPQNQIGVDFIASQEHWIDHLAPVYLALPLLLQGRFVTRQKLLKYATAKGINKIRIMESRFPYSWWPVTCGYADCRKAAGFRPILFQHGIGFSFTGSTSGKVSERFRSSSYAGGIMNDHVSMFLNPNEFPQRQWELYYPRTPSLVVGSPKMDVWHNAPPKMRSDPPVVCLSFHWDCKVSPETRWALDHFKDAIPSLAKRKDIQLIGHGHPRMRRFFEMYFNGLGIEFVPNFEQVLEQADLYVNDSSSTLYEFASLNRPVVVMNAPWYRARMNHGLRFWEYADVGVQVSKAVRLSEAIDLALEDLPEQQAARARAIEATYPYRGHAAERAAQVITEFVQRRGTWSRS